ncbi:hypothetical protein EVAR_32639_1 [Eumeta japonica]|uniref:Uncharacterized protein n=1 Tax=Eumeta variegata TaxID=151549 RepID=A0A4C1WUJ1_EUMVA|nr:hypothetical protein EVAR_32639_1 [Eumeta japonica]
MRNVFHTSSDEDKSNVSIGPSDAGGEEMELGDMDKLEQDTGNIAEVDIPTGLGGDDDEELLESLTAEIGEEFNILSYADPELSSFNDAEHILDGLELADEPVERHAKREPEDEGELKNDSKMDTELQKAVKNIENSATDQNKTQVKSEAGDTKSEGQETKTIETVQASNVVRHIYTEGGVQRVITQNQISMQGSMQTMKAEVKLEGEEGKPAEAEWRGVPCSPQRTVFSQTFSQQGLVSAQIPLQSMVQRPTQFLSGGPQVMGQQLIQRPQVQFAASQHAMHFQQGGGNAGIVTQGMVAGQVRRTRLVAPEVHTRPVDAETRVARGDVKVVEGITLVSDFPHVFHSPLNKQGKLRKLLRERYLTQLTDRNSQAAMSHLQSLHQYILFADSTAVKGEPAMDLLDTIGARRVRTLDDGEDGLGRPHPVNKC